MVIIQASTFFGTFRVKWSGVESDQDRVRSKAVSPPARRLKDQTGTFRGEGLGTFGVYGFKVVRRGAPKCEAAQRP